MVWIEFSSREKNFWVFLTLFLFYSFLGAVGEHISYYVVRKKKVLSNPIIEGFPIYGIGAYLAIYLNRLFTHKWHWIIEIIFFGFIISAIEYGIGFIGGAGANSYNGNGEVIWWDYTDTFLNINGIVNFRHFLTYGILAFVVTKIHPLLVERVNRMFN